jgi:hypothetical protein
MTDDITAASIASLIDVAGIPPSIAQIADLLRRYARPQPFEPGSVSFGIAAYAPRYSVWIWRHRLSRPAWNPAFPTP